MEKFSFKAVEFKQVDFLGEWRLDWNTHGQPRYKSRDSVSLKITTHGDIIEIIPAREQPVTIAEGAIYTYPLIWHNGKSHTLRYKKNHKFIINPKNSRP